MCDTAADKFKRNHNKRIREEILVKTAKRKVSVGEKFELRD